jgi:nucleoside-diphosphate-sugar epimerase
MNVVVTGSAGFIGRHVVAEAGKRGHRVQAWDRRSHDLRNVAGLAQALAGVDAVIHCAASLGGDAQTQNADTVVATENLLAAMREAGVKQIVGVSSFAVYDYQAVPAGSALGEDSPLEEDFPARAPYILAKRKQEDLIRAAGEAGGQGLRFTIIRPGIVYGPGRTWFHHLGMQLGAAQWVCLAGDGLFPVTHVESCAEAIVLALESSDANSATLNIVDDDLPTRIAYVRELARRTTPQPKIRELPWSLLSMGAATAHTINHGLLLGKLPVPGLLDPASLAERCKPLFYPNARAKQTLHWTPRYGFVEGLERSLAAS